MQGLERYLAVPFCYVNNDSSLFITGYNATFGVAVMRNNTWWFRSRKKTNKYIKHENFHIYSRLGAGNYN